MSRFNDYHQYVQDAMQSWNCPGVALAIVHGDDIVYQSVHGLRDVEHQLPMTGETRFAMASVTKSFTAMSVALLVDEGKLEWDSRNLRFPGNSAANRFVKPEFRKGWELKL